MTYVEQNVDEWYMVRCNSKNGYQKDMCIEIELHAQHTITNLCSIANIIGGPIRPFNEHEDLHFDNKIVYSYELRKS